MERLRNILIFAALGGAVISGMLLINLANRNNSIDTSSASVYNIVGLSQSEDEILYQDKIVIDINAQIIDSQKVNTGNIEISFDKNLLEVEDIVMPSNIIAQNQKIDTAEGKVTLQISTKNQTSLKDISTIAKIIFNKKASSGKFTSIILLPTSTLGEPNTLEPSEKSLSVSY